MNTRKHRRQGSRISKLLSMFLALAVAFSGIALPKDVFAVGGKDVTGKLTTKFTITSNGKPLADNAKIDGTQEIDIKVDIKAPLTDGSNKIVEINDTAKIEIASKLKLKTATTTMDIKIGTDKVGEYNFTTEGDKTYLNIKFVDPNNKYDEYQDLEFWVPAKFVPDLTGIDPVNGGETIVKILEKPYKFIINEPKSTVTLNKVGEVSRDANGNVERTIEWKLTATSSIGYLNGYTFLDDLNTVGEYVEDSFKFKYTPDGGTEQTVEPTAVYDATKKTISYKFQKDGTNDIKTPVTITFKTKMTDAQFMAIDNGDPTKSKQTTIVNTAKLKKGAYEVPARATALWKPVWSRKKLETTNVNPATGLVTWVITLNKVKADLKNVEIKDKLTKDIKNMVGGNPKDYKFEYHSAELTVKDVNDAIVRTENFSVAANTLTENAQGEVTIPVGNITGEVILKITAKVNKPLPLPDDFAKERKIVRNDASITWTDNNNQPVKVRSEMIIGNPAAGKAPGEGKYLTVTTSSTEENEVAEGDENRHFINFDTVWNIEVTHDYRAGGVVYDMMIFDNKVNETSLRTAGTLKLDSSSGATDIDGIPLNNLVPQGMTYHKFIEKVAGSNVTVTPRKLYVGEKHVGDLIVMTNFTDSDHIVKIKSNLVSVASLINSYTTVGNILDLYEKGKYPAMSTPNSVYLYKNGEFVDVVTIWTKYMSRMLEKEVLERSAAATFGEEGGAGRTAATINATAAVTTDQTKAFNYNNKTATYRLSVNASKIHDVSEQLGSLVVEDTLPAGWELVEYTVFKGKSKQENESTAITATGAYNAKTSARVEAENAPVLTGKEHTADENGVKLDYSNGKVKFTFENADSAYVIALKVKLTDDKLKEYVKIAKPQSVSNSAKVYLANYPDKVVTKSRSIIVDPKVVFKEYKIKPSNTELEWHIDYLSQGLVKEENAVIYDKLGENIELRTTKKDTLKFENEDGTKNFRIVPITLNDDGTKVEGTELALNDVKKYLTYSSDKRTLKFKIPDHTKGYRLYYITDLTGEAGSEVKNTATLEESVIDSENTPKPYVISPAAASAVATKIAIVEVTKIKKGGGALLGASFTLQSTGENYYSKTFTSGADGKVKFRGMPVGTYTLTETKAPDGYWQLNKVYNVEVTKVGNALKANIKEVNSNKITIENTAKDQPNPNPPGGGGGGGKIIPPEDPKKDEPKKDEPKPDEPSITPPAPPTPGNPENPTTPTTPTRPVYPRGNTPNPNNPNSPNEITVIDENGVPLGNFKKHQKPDGTMEYVLIEDENVPLADLLPKTGDDHANMYYMGGLSLIICGLGITIVEIQRRRRQTSKF